jgi:NAD(P)-dependent dehydrogenase (short-subunit alcohol dehydrogenase family)
MGKRSSVRAKVAVVTGAGSGIGRALALELATRGARVAVSDVNRAGLDETAAGVKRRGAEVHAAPLDVSDRDAFRRYVDEVVDHFGVVHQLYNNAGIAGAAGATTEVGYAAFEALLAVNLWGVIHGTKELLPHLIDSGDGHLINISSLNGFLAQPGMAAYCTSKFAVRGFTESVRAEMAVLGHPVKVTVVHPGGVRTNIATAAAASTIAAAPELAAEATRRAAVYNETLLRLPAERAAAIIVDGVEAGKSRVLVGNDARAVDAAVRLLPSASTRLAVWFERRMARARPVTSARRAPAPRP